MVEEKEEKEEIVETPEESKEEVEVEDSVVQQLEDLGKDKKDRGIQSKSKLKTEMMKKQRHFLVLGGKPKMNKSVICQSIAKDLGFKLVETEQKPYYFKNYNKQVRVTTFSDLLTEVLNTREPIVIDSITKPYQDAMAITPWQHKSKLVESLREIASHIQDYGGIVVAHGQIKTVINDDVYGEGDENTIPEVEFVVTGNQSWLYRTTGLVIVGRHVLSNKKRILVDGNHIPRRLFEIEVVKGTNGEPVVSGKGYEYIKYLLGNSMEMLISKGSK